MLCHAKEYAELPVRHNEDLLNGGGVFGRKDKSFK